MIEILKNIILMDGNGLFVWFCVIFLLLILALNIFFAHRRKSKIYSFVTKLPKFIFKSDSSIS